MSNLTVFSEYAAAFEETLKDDNWQRLEKYFSEESSYAPGDGSIGEGLAGTIQALRGSVELLERKTDSRELIGQPEVEETGDTITLKFSLRYTKSGMPDLNMVGTEIIRYKDGIIVQMEDVFEDAAAMIAWRGQL